MSEDPKLSSKAFRAIRRAIRANDPLYGEASAAFKAHTGRAAADTLRAETVSQIAGRFGGASLEAMSAGLVARPQRDAGVLDVELQRRAAARVADVEVALAEAKGRLAREATEMAARRGAAGLPASEAPAGGLDAAAAAQINKRLDELLAEADRVRQALTSGDLKALIDAPRPGKAGGPERND